MVRFKRPKTWREVATNPVFIGAMILTGLLLGSLFLSGQPIISGYDGIEARITDVAADGEVKYSTADGSVYQEDYWDGIYYKNPTGVVFEIDSAVDVEEKSPYGEAIEERIENSDGTDTIKHWDVYIVECSMGVTVKTSGGGMDAAKHIMITVELSENDFSVFTEYDENYAFILEVYTRNYTSTSGIVTTTPMSGGYSFPLRSVSTEPVPDWFADSGYNVGSLSKLSEVEFSIVIDNIQPTSLFWNFRGESQAVFDIGIDVFLVGYWEKTVQRGWDPPPEGDPWYQGLLDLVGGLGDVFSEPLMAIALIVGGAVVLVILVQFGGRKR